MRGKNLFNRNDAKRLIRTAQEARLPVKGLGRARRWDRPSHHRLGAD